MILYEINTWHESFKSAYIIQAVNRVFICACVFLEATLYS